MPEFWILDIKKHPKMGSDVFLVNEKVSVRLGAFEICLSKRPLRVISTFNHFKMLHKVQSAHTRVR